MQVNIFFYYSTVLYYEMAFIFLSSPKLYTLHVSNMSISFNSGLILVTRRINRSYIYDSFNLL